MTDLLSKARYGRLAALYQRSVTDLVRDAVQRHLMAKSPAVVRFQTRRASFAA